MDPDRLHFSNSFTNYEDYTSYDKVSLPDAIDPLVGVVVHIACAAFRLLISPFQQTLQFTAYELFSAYRNMELAFGVALAAFDKPYGHYLMHIAKENIDQYNYFLNDFMQDRETLQMLA